MGVVLRLLLGGRFMCGGGTNELMAVFGGDGKVGDDIVCGIKGQGVHNNKSS